MRLRRLLALSGSALLLVLGACGLDDPSSPEGAPAAKTGLGLPRGWLSAPQLFATGVDIVSIAATPSRVLAGTMGPAPAKIVALGEHGEIEPFTTALEGFPELACHVEVSPGRGGFAEGLVFAGLGSGLWLVAGDGGAATLFAELPAGDGEISGLAFDTEGAFGSDLLVLTQLGGVYRVGADADMVRVGSVGPGGRGPSIASRRFGLHAGQLLVAFPGESEVRTLDTAGNVGLLLRWSGVSGALTVPSGPRAFGSSGGSLFLATAGGNLYRFPLADLVGRDGELVLTSVHRSGSGLVTPEPSGWRLQPFGRFVGAEIAAGFVRRPEVMPIQIELQPGVAAKTLVVGSEVLVPVGVLATIGFTPSILEGGDVTFAGASPVPQRTRIGTYTDLDADGDLDLLLRFRPSDMQLAPGDATLVLDGQGLEGDRVRGATHVLVLSP